MGWVISRRYRLCLFQRPVGVDYAWTVNGDFADLGITTTGNHRQVVLTQASPMSVVQPVRSWAGSVETLGPYDADNSAESLDQIHLEL